MSKQTRTSSKTKPVAAPKQEVAVQKVVVEPIKTPVRRISIHEYAALSRIDMAWVSRLVSRRERKSVGEWDAWLDQISNAKA